MGRFAQVVVFLLSLSLVGLEFVWTRLFSAEFYYSFAFLILSLSILGLGLGALAVRLAPRFARPERLGALLGLTGLACLSGPPLVFRLGLEFSKVFSSVAMAGKLVVAILLLGVAFFLGGMCLAILFRRHHAEIQRLYMADLAGAGLGVMGAVALMNMAGTPWATFLSSIPVLLAAWLCSRSWLKALPAGLAAAMVVLGFFSAGLLEAERQERGPVIYKHWDAMAKIKLYGFGRQYRSFNIDNLANTGTYGFDGDWDRPEEDRFEFGIDVSNLIGRFESCTFLSLGAGGGSDVLQALQAGAGEIHAVEVIGQINRMLLEGDPAGYILPSPEPAWLEENAGEEEIELPEDRIITMAEFSGHIYRDPRVRVVTEDARAYVGRFRNEFDVIYSLSSNTFAALASGSFAMAENYLFTKEAFEDYWNALTEDGFMMMEHQFYMPRIVSSLIEALEEIGVEDPRSRFAVYDLPKMRRNMLLLSKRPLTDDIRQNAFGELTREKYEDIHLLYPAPEGLEDNLIARIVRDGWRDAAGDARVDISPATDDRPFIGQMGLWRNFSRQNAESMRMLDVFGFPLSRVILVTILAVLAVLVLPLNLIPCFVGRERLGAAPWIYFFLIGVGFMAAEVILIQQFTLFVGPAATSIATVLMTLLVSSGAGSRFAPAFRTRTPFIAIAVWLAADIALFGYLVDALGGLSPGLRILLTAVLVAPLGFFMGMPFPKAALRVGELVDWGFAVNGAASVLGATGILLVAFSYGYRVSLLVAAACYLLSLALLSSGGFVPTPRPVTR